jgi:alkylation response protein AidB-like acyl-CoA dehydrogenase
MTSVDRVTRTLPGSPEWASLPAQIGAGAKDRDLNDENPFDQVSALKRAGFSTLRLPEHLCGAGLTVPQLFSAIIDVARAAPIVAHVFRTHLVLVDFKGGATFLGLGQAHHVWFVEERLRGLDDQIGREVGDRDLRGDITLAESLLDDIGQLVPEDTRA